MTPRDQHLTQLRAALYWQEHCVRNYTTRDQRDRCQARVNKLVAQIKELEKS